VTDKLPANLEAEKAVLGGILLDNDAFIQGSRVRAQLLELNPECLAATVAAGLQTTTDSQVTLCLHLASRNVSGRRKNASRSENLGRGGTDRSAKPLIGIQRV
jgi:hypothetical protein